MNDSKYLELLNLKLKELGEEAIELSQRRLEYEQSIKDIDNRLAQVVGAIQAIDSILDRNNQNE